MFFWREAERYEGVAATVGACPLPETFPFWLWRHFLDVLGAENRSSEYVRGFCTRRTQGKVITLVDDERSETYATLDEAIKAAQTWYIGSPEGNCRAGITVSKPSRTFDGPSVSINPKSRWQPGAAQAALNCEWKRRMAPGLCGGGVKRKNFARWKSSKPL